MKKALEWLEKYRMIEKEEKITVGVSGGADSICLLFVLKSYQQQHPFSMEVVHVEHGIRGKESLEDAAFVRTVCEGLGVPFHLEQVDVKELARREGLSLEEAGRMARYRAFEKWREKTGACKTAVAHNADDQAETILWNLIRGTGLKGLGGILPVNGPVIRPLLGCTRQEIEAWLGDRGISYRTDATNLEEIYTRNKLRRKVIPYLERELNPRASRHIAMAGERIWRADAYLRGQAVEKAARIGKVGEGEARLNRELLLSEERIMQEYLIRWALEQAGGGLKDISAGHVEDLLKLAAAQSGACIHLPGNRRGICSGPWLTVTCKSGERKQPPEPVSLPLPGEASWGSFLVETRVEEYQGQIIPRNEYTKWFDYDTIKDTVYLRSRRQGDYLIGDALGSRRKLKKYFIDEKIPREERDQVLLLAEGSHVLWCVGYRISEAYKITKETRRILVVQVQEVKDE